MWGGITDTSPCLKYFGSVSGLLDVYLIIISREFLRTVWDKPILLTMWLMTQLVISTQHQSWNSVGNIHTLRRPSYTYFTMKKQTGNTRIPTGMLCLLFKQMLKLMMLYCLVNSMMTLYQARAKVLYPPYKKYHVCAHWCNSRRNKSTSFEE